jgi:arylsulfatase A-like enzyme
VRRNRFLPPLLAAALLAVAGCRHRPSPPPLPWQRLDLWQVRPEIEIPAAGDPRIRAAIQRISFLGAEEVRDMSRVPASQLAAFPKRTAGQVRAIEQLAGSRLRFRVRVDRHAYFSFTPLGAEHPCACTYRMGVREPSGAIKELYRVEAAPVGPFAPAAVEVALSEYAGRDISLLLQVDGPPHLPGQPFPSVLWGSPALYGRRPLPPAMPAARQPRADARRPNVLLLGIDTLRADELGPWGRKPSLSPAIDRLAGESDVWLDAFSTVNATNPSFASMMTGLYAKNHGVYDLQTPLPREHTTLAERLAAAGYDTLAILSAHHLGDHNSGLGQGFADVTLADEHFAAELAVDMTIDWLAGHAPPAGGRPFFAWVHLFDPHTPHTPPRPFADGLRPAAVAGLAPVRLWVPFRTPGPRRFDEPVLGGNRDLYDGEVAYLDRQVGRLLDWLDSRGLLAGTLVVLVADHGENVGDHGILFRHIGLFDSTTHVPLLIRWPGRSREGRRIRGLVQTIDLFPTLLAAAGLPVPPQDGVDLRRLAARGGRRAVFAEHSGKSGLMVRTRDAKYILSQGNVRPIADGAYLYDLAADTGETKNLAGRGLAAERELSDLLRRFMAERRGRPETRPQGLSPEEVRRLKSLGYL